jgi:hypothetical protein
MKGGKNMKKLLTILSIAMALSMLVVSPASANASKGQKLIIKKLKKPCGFDGGVLAKKHTQSEWKAIFDSGKLDAELHSICPKAKKLKKKYIKHVYDFLYNYASDSGNVPS